MKNQLSGEGSLAKIRSAAQAIRRDIVYSLLLQVVLRKDTVPIAHKVFIVSALIYFFWRSDVFPDSLPFVGYIDDIAALLGAISTVARHVTPAVEVEAQAEYDDYFSDRSDRVL